MVDFNDDFAAPGQWARQYREIGLQIMPGWMPSEVSKGQSWKRPKVKDWRQYQDVLVTDEVFLPWYGPGGEHVSRPNMGTICGRASGNLFIVDLDSHKTPAAEAWWNGVLAVHNNNMPLETAEQRTGGGGRQILFYAPQGYRTPTCKTSIGVDIRGQGGFAVLAPSIHDSGASYAWLDGLAPWDEAGIMMAPEWLLREIEALVAEHGGTDPSARPTHQSGAGGNGQASYDGFGHQTDLREQKMTELIWGAVVDWRREAGSEIPDLKFQLAKEAEKYLVYEGLVSPRTFNPGNFSKAEMLEREGRGRGLFHVKWQYAMRLWNTKVAEEAGKPGKDKTGTGNAGAGSNPWADEFAKANNNASQPGATPDIYPYLNVDQIMDKPDPVWMVDGLINEKALGFIFGPPSSLKTFIALDLALSIATSLPSWWDRAISRPGAVIYLCREGTSSFKFRIAAWEAHRKAKARGGKFYLIEHPTNFMNGADVFKVIETIKAIAAVAGVAVSAVFVDTVSRVLPGAEENLQKDMSLFVGACEYIQTAFGCIVVGLHHTNKNGAIRGSTVIPGAGDFLIETRRDIGAEVGSIVLQKVKDGEDGLELPFKVTKVDLPGIVPRTSLVVDPTGAARAAGSGMAGGDAAMPDIVVCREILAALALAWFQKVPWCKSYNGERPAVNMIAGRWQLKKDVVKRLLELWMANGVVEIAVYDSRKKLSGYRKLIDL